MSPRAARFTITASIDAKTEERRAVSVQPAERQLPAATLQRLFLRIIAIAALGLSGGCAKDPDIIVKSIDIVEFGILEFDQASSATDPTSSVGASMARAQGIRVSQHIDRIPLRTGLAYGVAFVVRGTEPGAVVDVKVVLKSTSPCKLKTTGDVVFHNDSILQVRLGEIRHVGARITAGDDNHCVDTPGPGTTTFEIYHSGRKLAEKSFQLYSE